MNRWAISTNGIRFIKFWETGTGKPQLHAYADTGGVMTIGYGHAIKPGDEFGLVITEYEAENLLVEDLRSAENGVNRAVQVDLSQNQYDALVSFTYNLGLYNLRKSTLLRKLNESDYDSVPEEMLRWCKDDINRDGKVTQDEVVPGLKRRREAEGKVWSKADYSAIP